MKIIAKNKLVSFLRSRNAHAGLSDKLKIIYRPFICPYGELLAMIEPHSKVFDIGCGSGQFCLLAAEFSEAHSIAGVEISKKLVDNAKALLSGYRNISNTDIQIYNGLDIPESLKNYDLVFLIDVFHHIPSHHQKLFLTNLYHAMKPGARLVIKDIDAKSFLLIFNKIHDLIISGEAGNEISADQLENILKKEGFKILNKKFKRELWYPHFFITVQK
jgi:2-polyprenyl-3-methyl-5-hydroxy-6-metoxy-1,4-benzoquinol methylase